MFINRSISIISSMATFLQPAPFSLMLFLFFFRSFILNPSLAQANPVKASYWFTESGFPVSSINAKLFTHLFCAFADLESATYQVTISSANLPLISQFTSTVRRSNPSVVTLLSIGGGGSNSTTFDAMASNPSSRKSFIDSSISLARSYGFSGLDLDWEYPLTSLEMADFATLIGEWRAAVSKESSTSGKPPLLLTAAVYFKPVLWSQNSYNVSAIKNSLDWVNVMSYDYYAPLRTNFTSAPAALYDPTSTISTSSGLDSWIKSELDLSKLVMGLPYYGYAWTLADPKRHGLGARTTGPAGPNSDGSMTFSQIQDFILQNGAIAVYDSTRVVNYCYTLAVAGRSSTWIGYDGVESILAKVRYAQKICIRGYFSWSVGADKNWLLSRTAYSAWI